MNDGEKHEARAFPGAKLRAPRGTRVINGLIVTLLLVLTGALVAIPELRTALGIFTAIIAFPILLGLLQFYQHDTHGGGTLEVGDDGVYVKGRLVMPRETIERAVVVPDERGVTVAIQRKKGFTAVFEVESEAQGRDVVSALGLSAAQTVSSFTSGRCSTTRSGTGCAAWRAWWSRRSCAWRSRPRPMVTTST